MSELQTYTKIPNVILENLLKLSLNGTQYRIILTIIRFTYGFNRDSHSLSETFLANATGIHKKQIQRELNDLINEKVLVVEQEATFTTSRIIKLNDDFNSYLVAKKLPPNQKDTHTGNELVPSPGSELAPQEIKPLKKQLKKNTYSQDELEILEFWNSKGIINHNQTEEMQKHIHNAIKKYGKESIIASISNYATVYHDNYFYNHIWRLDKFLKQANGISNFSEDGQTWLNYINRGVKGNEGLTSNGNESESNTSQYARAFDKAL